MTLKYLPFATSNQLLAVTRGAGPLGKGARGPGIKLLQCALLDLGYELQRSTRKRGAPDGVFDSETQGAITHFQTSQAIRADGRVGRITLTRLDALLAARVAAAAAQDRVASVHVFERASTPTYGVRAATRTR